MNSAHIFSRSARILEEMPSSDFVSSSRKCLRLPNIMSRITSRLHLSPTTSSVRLIGQPERCSSSMSGVPARGENATKKPLALLHQLYHGTTSCKTQAVLGRKRNVRQGENHPRRLCRLYGERPRGRRRCAGGGFPFHQPL